MKTLKIMTVSLVLAAGLLASAQLSFAEEAAPAWTCVAQGRDSLGDPMGDVWTMVRGDGDSEMSAADAAWQACVNQFLSSCQILSCHKN